MRNAFADEVTRLASADPRVVLLSGDIGNKLFDKFKQNNEGRFFNCGVAEANMMGVAAGMALSGLLAGGVTNFAHTASPGANIAAMPTEVMPVSHHSSFLFSGS